MAAVTGKTPGNGTGTLSYTIPGSGLDVESVYVSVDATGAGGPVTAELTITDQSGVVIARKPQGTTIAAGGAGSATWALRVDDDAAAASAGGIQFDVSPQTGNFFDLETIGPSFLGLTIEDAGPGGLYIRSSSNGYMLLRAVQQMELYASRLTLESDNDIEMQMFSVGDQVVIYDRLHNPIFEIWEDGSIHGRAAVGAITWDL